MKEVHLLFSNDHMDEQCKLHGAFKNLSRAKAVLVENIKTNSKHTTFFIRTVGVDDAGIQSEAERANGVALSQLQLL